MRFLFFGAGAIGTYIGGSLALAGENVVFIERSELAAQLVECGMRLEIEGTERKIEHPQVVASLEEAMRLPAFDFSVLAVKSFDTAAVIETIKPYAKAMPPVLCLQNGVENEPLLRQALGDEGVIAGSVTSAVGRLGPGAIKLERLRGVGVADYHPLSLALQAALSHAGLRARLYPSADGMKWSKMFTNLACNASSAILNMPPDEILADPRLFRMEIAELREALRVMDCLGLAVTNLPDTPVRPLAFAVRRLPPALSQPLMRKGLASGRGGKMPSFHIDLHAGRGRSEVDYLNGAVARFGVRVDVPAPVNRTLTRILLGMTAGEIPLEAYDHQPERLLAELPGQKNKTDRRNRP
jgi:2-dehydropantoate 2-reductase